MTLLLIDQLRFARSEFVRGLDGITDAEARRRFEPMNSISWTIGHLASQENTYWVLMGQDRSVQPELYKLVGHGQPASTPPLDEMWAAWQEITAAADAYLDALTEADLTGHLLWKGEPRPENIGTMLLRNTMHYWYHLGEGMAIRQMLGHGDLPQFVGDFGAAAYGPR